MMADVLFYEHNCDGLKFQPIYFSIFFLLCYSCSLYFQSDRVSSEGFMKHRIQSDETFKQDTKFVGQNLQDLGRIFVILSILKILRIMLKIAPNEYE